MSTEFSGRIPSLDNPPEHLMPVAKQLALPIHPWASLTIRNFFLIVKSEWKGWAGWE